MNPNNEENNWYLKHREDYGSWQWIKWKLFVYALTAAIAGAISIYFIDHNLTVKYAIMHWFCNLWYLIFKYFMSMILIYFILGHISRLDDVIGLKHELKSVAFYLVLIIFIGVNFRLICPSVIRIEHDLQNLTLIINALYGFLWRFSFFGITYMHTRWVVTKFAMSYHSGCALDFGDSTAITLSTTKMRNIAHEKTLHLMESQSDVLYPNERDKKFQMKNTLRSNNAFEAFMRELLKEYCAECLLSIVEMTQFKERIFAESSNLKQRQLMSESAERRNTEHSLQLPAECTKSEIVWKGDNYKSIAREIYLKYIESGAPYEINVEHRTMKQLGNLIDNDEWDSNQQYDDTQRL